LFSNIITNAIKFSRKNPLVEIRSRELPKQAVDDYPSLKSSKQYVEIVFKDNGIGFDQKYANQIFTIFQRLNSREKYPGTGVGLALCKKIVENHRGLIKAEGVVDQGATITVVLPLQ
jgi:signal transduction histidine kinase